jgi:hypothetical protein
MGLDMYLEARKYVSRHDYVRELNEFVDNPQHEELIQNSFPDHIDKFAESVGGTVSISVAQWRKANAVHQWFVDNVQEGEDDCGEHYVSPHKIGELADLIDQIFEAPEGEERDQLAEELLPTADGCFFGSQEYNEYYYEHLEYTRDMIRHLQQIEDFESLSFYYSSSW